MTTVLFISSFKLDRINLLGAHLLPLGVELTSLDISEKRNPIHVMSEILRRPKSTILMTHESMMVPICFFLASFVGYRYIYIQNGVLWHTWDGDKKIRKAIRHNIYRWILARAMWVVTNSDYLKDKLVSYQSGIQSKVICIHNAIDLPKPADQFFNFEEGKHHLVTITNFEYPLKFEGVYYLLRAISKVCPNASFHVLAKVLTSYGEENLNTFCERVKQELDVEVLYHVNVDITQFMSPEVTFLYCSLPGGDSFPRAVIEVLSLGIPSLIVDTNGVAEAIAPGMARLAPLDISCISEGVMEILNDQSARYHMSVISRRKIREMFTWDRMAEEYARLCLSM